jgi:hypothetical protein
MARGPGVTPHFALDAPTGKEGFTIWPRGAPRGIVVTFSVLSIMKTAIFDR